MVNGYPLDVVYFFNPAVTKYHLDKANARASFGIFPDIGLHPGAVGMVSTSSPIYRFCESRF
jgi:hypothetical protein